jgi:hypothetical protein
LEAQGRERIGHRIGELRQESGKLEAELSDVRKQIEARIQELTRAKAERVRESIEQSIVGLEEARKDTEGRRALLAQSIEELESLVSKDKSLFSEYRSRLQEVLKKPEADQKAALADLVNSLLLQDGGIKIALSGVSQKALRSSVLVFAPPAGLEPATGRLTRRIPGLIEDTLGLQPRSGQRGRLVAAKDHCRPLASASASTRPTAENCWVTYLAGIADLMRVVTPLTLPQRSTAV